MAVRAEGNAVRSLGICQDVAEELGVLVGHRKADGVGQVYRLSSGGYGGLDRLYEKLSVGAGGILGGELDLSTGRGGVGNGVLNDGENLVARLFELVFKVNVAGCDKDVQHRTYRRTDCGVGNVDVASVCSAKGAYRRPFQSRGNGGDGCRLLL